MLEREGVEGALAFIEQSIRTYKGHLKYRKKSDPKRSFARSREYRRKFIVSIKVFEYCKGILRDL